MTPNCARQERRAPRDFSTATGMIGSAAIYSSVTMNAIRRTREAAIGCQRTFGKESPKRKETRVAIWKALA